MRSGYIHIPSLERDYPFVDYDTGILHVSASPAMKGTCDFISNLYADGCDCLQALDTTTFRYCIYIVASDQTEILGSKLRTATSGNIEVQIAARLVEIPMVPSLILSAVSRLQFRFSALDVFYDVDLAQDVNSLGPGDTFDESRTYVINIADTEVRACFARNIPLRAGVATSGYCTGLNFLFPPTSDIAFIWSIYAAVEKAFMFLFGCQQIQLNSALCVGCASISDIAFGLCGPAKIANCDSECCWSNYAGFGLVCDHFASIVSGVLEQSFTVEALPATMEAKECGLVTTARAILSNSAYEQAYNAWSKRETVAEEKATETEQRAVEENVSNSYGRLFELLETTEQAVEDRDKIKPPALKGMLSSLFTKLRHNRNLNHASQKLANKLLAQLDPAGNKRKPKKQMKKTRKQKILSGLQYFADAVDRTKAWLYESCDTQIPNDITIAKIATDTRNYFSHGAFENRLNRDAMIALFVLDALWYAIVLSMMGFSQSESSAVIEAIFIKK